jgi:hypothetical protein
LSVGLLEPVLRAGVHRQRVLVAVLRRLRPQIIALREYRQAANKQREK